MPHCRQSKDHRAVFRDHYTYSAEGGAFYGPSGPIELWGKAVKKALVPKLARDEEHARRLWEASAKAVKLDVLFS